MLGHLWFTRCLSLIIIIYEEGNLHLWIDGARTVCADGKGHSGLVVTIGTGAIINVSNELGVGTVRSVETEVVSIRETFTKCTWFRHFRVAQGEVTSKE